MKTKRHEYRHSCMAGGCEEHLASDSNGMDISYGFVY